MRYFSSLLLLVVAIAGCESPEADQRMAMREGNLRKTANLLESKEREHPEQLRSTVRLMEKRYQQDIRESSANRDRVENWINADFDHWERVAPLYKQEFERRMQGDERSIERTWPMMAY